MPISIMTLGKIAILYQSVNIISSLFPFKLSVVRLNVVAPLFVMRLPKKLLEVSKARKHFWTHNKLVRSTSTHTHTHTQTYIDVCLCAYRFYHRWKLPKCSLTGKIE